MTGHQRLSGQLRRADVAGAESMVLRWADVEPTRGAVVLPARVGPTRLTIRGGTDAPRWLAEQTGTVPVVQPLTERLLGHAARWWHPAYVEAWAALHVRLAATFDTVARMTEVTLGCPHGHTGDLWDRQGGLRLNREQYVLAGWTAEDDTAATTAMIEAQEKAWPNTTQTLWVGPADHLTLSGVTYRMEPALVLAERLASNMGDRLLLGASRRLSPDPAFADALARLARATGPRAALSTTDHDQWPTVLDPHGIAVTSTET